MIISKLSKKHPCEDICDDLAGDYPKLFVFTGWHPQCFCYVTPILGDEDEMAKITDAFLEGNDYEPQFEQLEEYPKGFEKWVKEQSDRIEKGGKLPYFIRDNKKVVNIILSGENKQKAFKNNAIVHKAEISKRRKEYQEYVESGWHKLYFDEDTGGYNVVHPMHQFSNSKPKGVPKTGGEAEKWLGIQLARQGKIVKFLPESGIEGKRGDMFFDGLEWDCKYIPLAKEETIRTYFKDARKADCVIFTFEEVDRYADIMKAINREIGRYNSQGRNIQELPDVYIFSKAGKLRLIKKIKGV